MYCDDSNPQEKHENIHTPEISMLHQYYNLWLEYIKENNFSLGDFFFNRSFNFSEFAMLVITVWLYTRPANWKLLICLVFVSNRCPNHQNYQQVCNDFSLIWHYSTHKVINWFLKFNKRPISLDIKPCHSILTLPNSTKTTKNTINLKQIKPQSCTCMYRTVAKEIPRWPRYQIVAICFTLAINKVRSPANNHGFIVMGKMSAKFH